MSATALSAVEGLPCRASTAQALKGNMGACWQHESTYSRTRHVRHVVGRQCSALPEHQVNNLLAHTCIQACFSIDDMPAPTLQNWLGCVARQLSRCQSPAVARLPL